MREYISGTPSQTYHRINNSCTISGQSESPSSSSFHVNLEKSLNLLQYQFFIYQSGVNDPCLRGFVVMNNRDNTLVLGKQLFNKLASLHAVEMVEMDTLSVQRDGVFESLDICGLYS